MSDTTILPGSVGAGRAAPERMPRHVAFSAARGAALIGIAVILGIVLLQVIDDGTSGPVGDGGSGGAATGGSTTTTVPGDTTTTTAAVPEPRPPQEVRVLVLNGSGQQGAATALTNQLKTLGYPTETPADAPNREGTVVYYKPGYEREAATLATAVGNNATVEPMPDPAPTGSERANLVVVIGT